MKKNDQAKNYKGLFTNIFYTAEQISQKSLKLMFMNPNQKNYENIEGQGTGSSRMLTHFQVLALIPAPLY